MRIIQRLSLVVLATLLSAPTAHAVTGVVEVFVPDPGFEGGGYWELTVTNSTTENVYLLAVANSGADVVFVVPAMVGQWTPDRWGPSEWDEGIPFEGAGFTPPDTRDFPYVDHFDGYDQVLTYYVLAPGTPIAPGETRGGFRFLSASGGSPFVLFGDGGAIVAEGETTGDATAVTGSTWGAVKALYR